MWPLEKIPVFTFGLPVRDVHSLNAMLRKSCLHLCYGFIDFRENYGLKCPSVSTSLELFHELVVLCWTEKTDGSGILRLCFPKYGFISPPKEGVLRTFITLKKSIALGGV
jgi:hypothetical protein